jgi:hypothetical protein
MDRFEGAIVITVLILTVFVAFAQIDTRKEHDEKKLAKALQMKQFLAGTSFVPSESARLRSRAARPEAYDYTARQAASRVTRLASRGSK